MAPSSLVRLGGLVAVVAGVLLLIADLWNLLLEILVGSSENFGEFAVTTSWAVIRDLPDRRAADFAGAGRSVRSSVGGRRRFGASRILAALIGTGLLVGMM